MVPRPPAPGGHGSGVGAEADGGAGRATHAQRRGHGSDPLVNFIDQPVSVPNAASGGVRELRSALAACGGEGLTSPAGQLERIRDYLEPVIARTYDAAAARLQDLDQLACSRAGYETRERFLAELTLDPPASTADLAGPPSLDEDYLVLSTIHSAKGLEWDVVHLIHASDGNIPSDMALATTTRSRRSDASST